MTVNDLVLFKEALKSFNQKIEFFDIFIKKIMSFNNFIKESTFFDNFNIREKKSSILNLIKNAQKFDLLCKQISSQFHEKLKENFSFILHENEILRKTDHVFVSH